MTAIKSFTDLEQSKVLANILPIESADMVLLHEEPYETSDSKFDGLHQALCVPFSKYDKSRRQKYKNISYFPCWSLAALLGILPDIHLKKYIYDGVTKYYATLIGIRQFNSEHYDNPVDACVEMIIRLNKLKLL